MAQAKVIFSAGPFVVSGFFRQPAKKISRHNATDIMEKAYLMSLFILPFLYCRNEVNGA